MPRNGSGTYSLPVAPFVPNTAILSAEVNDDFDDIADALTASVAADGQTPMTGPLLAADGVLALPGWSWVNDPNTGRYRPSADVMVDVVGGAEITRTSATGFDATIIKQGGFRLVPAGLGPLPYSGATAPDGWLLCYGQSISRATYADLFAAIGTAYGSVDVNTFNVPDMRGRVPAGKDNMGGTAASRLTVTTMTPDGQTLAAVGGAQTLAILQTNLPNVAFTVSGIALNDPGHLHVNQFRAAELGAQAGGGSSPFWNGTSNLNSAASTTGITISSQGSAASGGSGTSIDKMQPTIITNYIIKT